MGKKPGAISGFAIQLDTLLTIDDGFTGHQIKRNLFSPEILFKATSSLSRNEWRMNAFENPVLGSSCVAGM